jgi:hypothetical protein
MGSNPVAIFPCISFLVLGMEPWASYMQEH